MSRASSDETSTDAACRTLAWLILSNKPVYPLTIWWLTGNAWHGWLTALTAPLYLLLAMKARGTMLRAGIPVLALLDTFVAMKLFGSAGGGVLFVAPIVLLAALALGASERWLALGIAAVGAALALFNGTLSDPPLVNWTAEQIAALFSFNRYSILALSLFIVWRFQPLRGAP